jgi:cell pole-organizing protein PopZ
MTQPAKSQEPSMEEILASIRRIIADDDATKTPTKGPEPVKAEAPPAPPAAAPPMSPAPAGSARPHSEPEADPAMQPSNPPEVVSVADQSSDILDLTESMAAMPQPSPAAQAASVMPNSQFRTIDGSPDVGFDEDSDSAMAANPAPAREERGSLMSQTTTAAVDSAFNALAQTVLAQNARTLEDLVREMLRPMLKSWLDDNLPSMVERLVRAEIERVSRGRAS